MSPYRLSAVLACGLLLALLAACEDPASVGAGVGEELTGGEPVTVAITPSTFEGERIGDVTTNSTRILSGTVDDPVIGQVSASGYLDFSRLSTVPPGFPEGTVSRVELRLFPDYAYGDTLRPMRLALHDMPNEWDASDLTSDTSLAAGSLAQEFTLTPADSVVKVLLPNDWITAHGEVLRDTSEAFADRFHGFQIQPVDDGGNAVVGFDVQRSQLRVTVDDDTASFAINETFSSLDRSGGNLPPNRVLLQDGTGIELSLGFTLPDSLRNTPVNRAEIRIRADTTTLNAALPDQPDFVRHTSTSVQILGIPEGDDTPVAITPSSNPLRIDAQARLIFGGEAPRSIFENELLGGARFERFRLRLILSENTINPLLFFGPGAGERAPQLLLTVTPLNE